MITHLQLKKSKDTCQKTEHYLLDKILRKVPLWDKKDWIYKNQLGAYEHVVGL